MAWIGLGFALLITIFFAAVLAINLFVVLAVRLAKRLRRSKAPPARDL